VCVCVCEKEYLGMRIVVSKQSKRARVSVKRPVILNWIWQVRSFFEVYYIECAAAAVLWVSIRVRRELPVITAFLLWIGVGKINLALQMYQKLSFPISGPRKFEQRTCNHCQASRTENIFNQRQRRNPRWGLRNDGEKRRVCWERNLLWCNFGYGYKISGRDGGLCTDMK